MGAVEAQSHAFVRVTASVYVCVCVRPVAMRKCPRSDSKCVCVCVCMYVCACLSVCVRAS